MAVPVTILIPVYNAAATLPACLDSISAQTFPDFEVVIINDGSTDASVDILNAYAARDSRFRVISQENVGQYPTRNRALLEGTGRYVLFVDCDDVIAPDLVDKAYHRAEAEQADITLFGWDYLVSPYSPPDVACWNLEAWRASDFSGDFPLGYGYAWMKLFKRAFIDEHALRFPENFYSKADVVFHWKSMSLAGRVTVIPEVLYHYRVHENSITGTIGGRFVQVIEVMEAIKHELLAIGDPRGLLPAWAPFAMRFIRSAYTQLPDANKPEMITAIKQFIGRLDESERELFRSGPGKDSPTMQFFRAVEQDESPAGIPGHRSGIRARIRLMAKNFFPDGFRRAIIDSLTRRSFTLSTRLAAEQRLRRTVAELNEVTHQLAVENHRLKQSALHKEHGPDQPEPDN